MLKTNLIEKRLFTLSVSASFWNPNFQKFNKTKNEKNIYIFFSFSSNFLKKKVFQFAYFTINVEFT